MITLLNGNISLLQARLLLIIIAASYGSNTIVIKILEENLEPSYISLLRFTAASLLFLPYMFRDTEKNLEIVKDGLLIGFANAVGFYAQSVALMTAAASHTAFTGSLTVIVVPVMEALFGKAGRQSQNHLQNESVNDGTMEKIGKGLLKRFLPALVAIAGVACLELGTVS